MDLCSEPNRDFNPIYESISESAKMSVQRSRQSLSEKFNREFSASRNIQDDNSSQLARSNVNWCDGFSLTMPNVNAKQALRSGAEKLSQTFNNMRTTFGTLSQKLRKSTRRRQPLKNIESPKTPVTPYTKSRSVLGRTPTKLYSPFSIDTPQGKENITKRSNLQKISPVRSNQGAIKKKIRAQKSVLKVEENKQPFYSPGMKLASDLEQTQIGIYEFQSTANRIIRRSIKN